MRPLVFSDTITIRTDRGLRRAIEDAARREGASTSDLIRRALASAVQTPASTNTAARA